MPSFYSRNQEHLRFHYNVYSYEMRRGAAAMEISFAIFNEFCRELETFSVEREISIEMSSWLATQ